MTTATVTSQMIDLAREHVDSDAKMAPRAQECLAAAVALAKLGDHIGARRRALRSLECSVGLFNVGHQRAAAIMITADLERL